MAAIEAIVSGKIELRAVPAPLLRKIKQELTLDNPKYSDAVSNGRSTRKIPKKITLFSKEKGSTFLPRGYWSRFSALVEKNGCKVNLTDNTVSFPPQYPDKKITLWDYQEPWVKSLLSKTQGVGKAPAGCGKTILALKIYAELGQP